MREGIDAERLLRSYYAGEIEAARAGRDPGAPRRGVRRCQPAKGRGRDLKALLVAAASLSLICLSAATAPPPPSEAMGLALVRESIGRLILSSQALAPLRDVFPLAGKKGGSI